MDHRDVLVCVPARTGSVRVQNKNFEPIAGRSLTERAVESATEAGFRHIIVSTDHPTWTDERVTVDRRPASLARSDTPMLDVLRHIARTYPCGEAILLLQPTSPLRTREQLREALARLQPAIDSVIAAEELVPHAYRPNGICYLFRVDNLSRYGHLYGRTTYWLPVDPRETVNIDTQADWDRAETLLNAREAEMPT